VLRRAAKSLNASSFSMLQTILVCPCKFVASIIYILSLHLLEVNIVFFFEKISRSTAMSYKKKKKKKHVGPYMGCDYIRSKYSI
jgi:hypothetical protein